MVLRSAVPSSFPPGSGQWLFNVSLLVEDEFLPAVSWLWADWRSKKSSIKSLMKWSDEGKSGLKGFCIRLGTARSRTRSQARDLLSRLAGHLQVRVDRGHTSEVAPLHGVLGQLAELDFVKAGGAQVRARCRWAEEGEYSSAFFLQQEKRRGARSWISTVRNDAGDVVTDLEGILTAFRSFYQSLFSAEDFADDVGCPAAILSLD